MKLFSIVAVALIGAGGVGAAPSTAPTAHESDALTAKASRNLDAYLAKKGYPNPKKCNKNNTAVRKEWYVLEAQELQYCPDTNRSTLSSGEKLNYIKAVQCMSTSPAKTPAGIAAGAKNRYDDFVVTHINQTLSIHGTVSFPVLVLYVPRHLTPFRATSSAGIATLLGRTSRYSATSAGTKAINRTITGHCTFPSPSKTLQHALIQPPQMVQRPRKISSL
jgi:hypothetical protein